MAIETKSRSELKSYFVKNAIPTEANFGALIDAPLNQTDDGVFKLGSEPLSVVAAPGERKPTLRLYDTYPAPAPSWTISLKPSQTPNDASTARAGFGIVDGEGNTRLFIDRTSGALGVGVNAPQGAMEVVVPGAHPSWNRFVVAASTDWGNGNAHVTIGSGADGIMLRNPHVSWMASENRASIRYGLSGGAGGKFWDVGIRTDNKFTFSLHGPAQHKLSLDATGNLIATGTVSSTGLIFDGAASGHLERDGSLYRTGGQVYLTVDDSFYIRKKSGDWQARFLTTDGSLTVKGHIKAAGAEGMNTFKFLPSPANIRLTSAKKQVVNDIAPPNVPANATAIIVTITTFNDARDDHVVHSFGRNASHADNLWDKVVYDRNTYLNDVLITHNGETAGKDYYGRSHGSHIIPLKSNGKFDAFLCMGYTRGTHYITLQVYGYVS